MLALSITFCLAGAVNADEAREFELNIPRQNVETALNELATQVGAMLLFPYDSVQSVNSNAINGRYTVAQALEILLRDTRLSGGFTEGGVITISHTKSVEAREEPEGEEMNVREKAGLGTILAAFFSVGANAQEPADTDVAEPQLEEIVVVGTHFKGIDPVGADVITLDREYIEQSGIATTTELIQSVPQNFGLGNEAVSTVGIIDNAGATGTNWSFSSSVDLRGLGTDSTLVLLNGRRSASGGSAGNFVDLNTVPTAAIERIDVLPDGASAIYGSDAVGGVVNVILRDDYEGAETSVRYAPGTSDIEEIQFNQVFGKKWTTGNVLFSYEYYDRSELKSADRAYTRDSDLTNFGGEDHSSIGSNPGNIDSYTLADGTRMTVSFPIPSGQDGTALTPADLVAGDPNLQNIREGSYVLPENTRQSVFVSASQALSSTVDLFAEARYSTREFSQLNRLFQTLTLTVPSSNAFFVDPFGGSQSLRLRYSLVDDYGPIRSIGNLDAVAGMLGVNFDLSSSWGLEVYGSHGTEDTDNRSDGRVNTALLAPFLANSDPNTAFNPFGDGSNTNPATLEAIKGFAQVNTESELTTANLLVDGDLFELPGGAAKLAVGAQYREQSLFSNVTNFVNTPEPAAGFSGDIFALDRDVKAAFAEIYLPIVTDQNSRPGIRDLAVSIAGRYEDYSDFGDTFDPKLGVGWSPVESLKLRGTVGTSFRAPLLTELNDTNNRILLFNLPDLSSPTGSTGTLLKLGNSPNLVPQEGTTWTAGFDITPASLPGFQVGLTYFDTSVDKMIQLPTNNPFGALLDPVTNAPIITFDPDDTTVAALLNDPSCANCGGATPDDVGALVDFRTLNVAKVELSGVDLNLAYAFETGAGAFNLSLYTSYLFDFKEQLVNGPLVDNVDTITNPTSLKLRSSLSWNSGGMSAMLTVKHIGDYVDDLGTTACAIQACPVDSWTTWDVHLGYDFSDQFSGFLDGIRLSLNVQNVFDRDPPFVDLSEDAVGFDAINANPMGRFAAIQLTKKW